MVCSIDSWGPSTTTTAHHTKTQKNTKTQKKRRNTNSYHHAPLQISDTESGVSVTTASGEVLNADAVVVTVSCCRQQYGTQQAAAARR